MSKMKRKLPANWITVNSKSHPDRMYYFNVKTNVATWTQPKLDESSETSSANDKHKDHDRTEHHKKSKSNTRMSELKPSLAVETSCEQSSCKIAKETAQMTTIREKMREKSKNVYQKSAKNGAPVQVSDRENCVTTFTPEMHRIHERMNTESNKRIKWNARVEYEENNNQNKNNSDKHQEKTSPHSSGTKSKNKKENPPLKKNIAMERMQKIRKRQSNDKVSIPEKTKRMLKNILIEARDGTKVPTHHDVEVRLKKLHNKIIKESTQKDALLRVQQNTQRNEKDDGAEHSKQPTVTENMTKDELIQEANREIFYEDMDWEPMKAEEIILEVEVARTQLNKKNSLDEINHISENTKLLIQSGGLESQDKGPLYVVVDTNVFLSNLEIIEQVKNSTIENSRPFIVIPWTVLRELDFIKENKHKEELRIKARKAIAFIKDQLTCQRAAQNPRFIGQTHEEAQKNKQKFSLECPDDEILQCCLQLRESQKSVILLSYDKNLCNKALIHKIEILEYGEQLEKLHDSTIVAEESCLTNNIFEDTKAVMNNFLSTIVTKQMSEIYGLAEWKRYIIIRPPWTVVTVLKCVIRHWFAAISESFQRRAENILKELLPTFEHTPVGGRKLRDMEQILDKCSDLMQMVNMDKYGDLMTQTFNAITELKKKCQQYISDIDQKKLYEKMSHTENVEEQTQKATKAFSCFQHIYNHVRDICGLACNVAGIAHSFLAKPVDVPLSQTALQHIRPEMSKNLVDLTTNLTKLLEQADDSIKYETLRNLQQSMSTFLPEKFDVQLSDIYYCKKLKQDALQNGLSQLQDLSTHFCVLATRI